MRIIFMGTPEFSVPVLEEIVGLGHEIVAVYTRAPKPAGRRGLEMQPSPVHAAAERLGLRVLTPKSLKNPEEAATFVGFEADVAVVVAYGLILPKAILDATRLGCLNLHASLLPRWRGAAPIQRAIMAGDAETGIMVMRMEEGLDTGAVALAEKTAIGPQTTAGELHDRLSRLGADLIGRALAALGRGTLVFTAQAEDGVTYAHKIDKAEARIDWSKPAAELHNLVRGLSPFPGAFFEADLGKGTERIKVLHSRTIEGNGAPGTVCDEALGVACGTGVLRLLTVQRAGKAPMTAAEFLRGIRISPGTFLGSRSE
ncbi:methionyl-tRNA formyltransferase [Methylovirgula sp. HY1]|uniref:methionyl-tRNA formyltransferase n=1 Tax=Methylovirgula sp. HY1 TaxID=2822761 RepID=UPI001C5BBB76|nr:methionyl-tRNA formyltransferase [Methylovirgula sp. HY1]